MRRVTRTPLHVVSVCCGRSTFACRGAEVSPGAGAQVDELTAALGRQRAAEAHLEESRGAMAAEVGALRREVAELGVRCGALGDEAGRFRALYDGVHVELAEERSAHGRTRDAWDAAEARAARRAEAQEAAAAGLQGELDEAWRRLAASERALKPALARGAEAREYAAARGNEAEVVRARAAQAAREEALLRAELASLAAQARAPEAGPKQCSRGGSKVVLSRRVQSSAPEAGPKYLAPTRLRPRCAPASRA
jgi:chromosome segregation ATPase